MAEPRSSAGALPASSIASDRRRHGGGVARSGRIPAGVIVVACGILLYGFLFSGDFLVASVVVRGTSLGDPAEVATVADAIGEPIFSIDASQAAGRVARLPYVERVTVRTSFPDKVTITVVERQPVLAWQAGGQVWLVDTRGHILTGSAPAPDGVPTIVSEMDAPAVGGTLDPAIVAAGVAATQTLGTVSTEVRWTRDDGLVATLRDGRHVILGSPDRMPMKLAVYQTVVGSGAAWQLLDLREPDRPYYK
ncbi:MAG TPA: FtsQ-type POTRA domain-containing protein [Thermomicrobiales bacterium]|nr:peptide ABC transporter permease [Chloroflexota bacterium]HQZ89196.1 FtsQ-type POTRA domain-containing protein [Thermomicrobiales bacterium]HRA31114.1 FtsQ-type POTRA domain-containing protein [Thermomicrobiales bacterium]